MQSLLIVAINGGHRCCGQLLFLVPGGCSHQLQWLLVVDGDVNWLVVYRLKPVFTSKKHLIGGIQNGPCGIAGIN